MTLAQQVEGMYSHAFGSYMMHAFPHDELRPLSCDGRKIRERGDLDAVLGNYSLTLIDALDSLVVFRRYEDFRDAVLHVSSGAVSFDIDVEVSTFEVNIRILGGLLSGHLHALRHMEGYTGALLNKARDLARRLKPAFDTPTGMPLSRVNLRRGQPEKAGTAVTIAEAGSFLLEFGVLSLLTGDPEYYEAARRSLLAFWSRRSSLGLVGTVIDVNTGEFQDAQSTTGPGQDSFYEYLLKGYILFDDLELLDIFLEAYAAVEQHHTFEGFTYTVDMFKGVMSNTNLSPLSCVWASLQVLAGDVAGALRTVLYWYGLWSKHGALPEVFDTRTEAPTSARDSPLRPELAEAVFYLSLALPDDPMVFGIARSMIAALNTQSRVACGFAAVADVTTKRLDDRMDSFFLSETLVYLYLAVAPLEDRQQAIPGSLASVVFTTEGHIFDLHQLGELVPSRSPAGEPGRLRAAGMFPGAAERPMLTCEAMSPFERVAVEQRCQTKYILTTSYQLQTLGHAPGRCRPQEAVAEVWRGDRRDGSAPLLRLQALTASFGAAVPSLPPLLSSPVSACNNNETGSQACDWAEEEELQKREALLRPPESELGLPRLDLDLQPGQMPPFSAIGAKHVDTRTLFATRRLVAARPLDACSNLLPLTGTQWDLQAATRDYEGRIVLVLRGSCLFLQKLQNLQRIRAAAALVMNHEGSDRELQVMTCPLQERGAGRDIHIPAAMISAADGQRLLREIEAAGDEGLVARLFTEH